MRIEDIEIHVGEAGFEYTPVRKLEAKCEATMAFSPAPTVDEMNGKLRSMAAKVGANAVVDVRYDSGVSITSWKSMKGTGLAVIKLSDDVQCRVCAETIKRAAVKCRFCGSDVAPSLDASASGSPNLAEPVADHEGPAIATPAIAAMTAEPLRETSNPQTWLIIGAVVFVVLTLIGMMAG